VTAVRRALLAAVVIVAAAAGCRYDDPDLTGVHFTCDATHGCPDGEQCVGGVCSGGGGGDGVACNGTQCMPGDQCCVDFVNAPRCIGAAESCPGMGAVCDGIEDCPGGRCCDDGGGPACGAAACDTAICVTGEDCPGSAPNCCVIDPTLPWGQCFLQCF